MGKGKKKKRANVGEKKKRKMSQFVPTHQQDARGFLNLPFMATRHAQPGGPHGMGSGRMPDRAHMQSNYEAFAINDSRRSSESAPTAAALRVDVPSSARTCMNRSGAMQIPTAEHLEAAHYSLRASGHRSRSDGGPNGDLGAAPERFPETHDGCTDWGEMSPYDPDCTADSDSDADIDKDDGDDRDDTTGLHRDTDYESVRWQTDNGDRIPFHDALRPTRVGERLPCHVSAMERDAHVPRDLFHQQTTERTVKQECKERCKQQHCRQQHCQQRHATPAAAHPFSSRLDGAHNLFAARADHDAAPASHRPRQQQHKEFGRESPPSALLDEVGILLAPTGVSLASASARGATSPDTHGRRPRAGSEPQRPDENQGKSAQTGPTPIDDPKGWRPFDVRHAPAQQQSRPPAAPLQTPRVVPPWSVPAGNQVHRTHRHCDKEYARDGDGRQQAEPMHIGAIKDDVDLLSAPIPAEAASAPLSVPPLVPLNTTAFLSSAAPTRMDTGASTTKTQSVLGGGNGGDGTGDAHWDEIQRARQDLADASHKLETRVQDYRAQRANRVREMDKQFGQSLGPLQNAISDAKQRLRAGAASARRHYERLLIDIDTDPDIGAAERGARKRALKAARQDAIGNLESSGPLWEAPPLSPFPSPSPSLSESVFQTAPPAAAPMPDKGRNDHTRAPPRPLSPDQGQPQWREDEIEKKKKNKGENEDRDGSRGKRASEPRPARPVYEPYIRADGVAGTGDRVHVAAAAHDLGFLSMMDSLLGGMMGAAPMGPMHAQAPPFVRVRVVPLEEIAARAAMGHGPPFMTSMPGGIHIGRPSGGPQRAHVHMNGHPLAQPPSSASNTPVPGSPLASSPLQPLVNDPPFGGARIEEID